MPMMRFALAAMAAALVLAAPAAFAQAWPTKPILVVVPLQAGTAVDTVARLVAQRMAENLGKPVVVENQPGAAGQIGAERIARAAPDGYVLGFVNDSILTMLPNLNPNLPYDPVRDFAPVSRVAGNAFGIAVNPDSPFKSLADLVAAARAKPGTVAYATGGNGSPQHMAVAMFAAAANIDLAHIPYKGAAQALTDVVGGQVPVIAQGLGVVQAQAKAGKLRVIAVTGPERSSLLPEVPTVREAGYPGFEFATWFAVIAPRATPEPLLERLNAEVVRAARDPEVRKRLVELGYDVDASSRERLAQSMREGLSRMGAIIRAAGIKAD
jgi:tripartite-type tricarboxylate transporter receptor subunit TctC